MLLPHQAVPKRYRNHMCLQGIALHHPAADILLEYAIHGCPVLTGQPWTKAQMQVAINCGPHILAMVHKAMIQLDAEVLGWEFRFLVPISGTPIRSGIPIPFLIPKIPVGIFLFKFRC